MSHQPYIRHVPRAKLGILMLHGFLGSPKHFEAFVAQVPETVAVYNILLDGHNAGVREFGRASMECWKQQAEEAAQILLQSCQEVVIVAHSMGTFFAMELAVKYPEKIKSLLLLQSPLKIGLKMAAPINTVKSFFGRFSNNPMIQIYQNAHSVKLTLRVWEYIPWIPRYLELFAESKKARETIQKVTVHTYLFQSKKDELVSMKSLQYIPRRSNIHLEVLQNSAHFIYREEDFYQMLDCFIGML